MSKKGPGFEREVCDRLSFWWTGDPQASVFWRTANSGGRATVRHRKRKKTSGQHGDVCATDPCGQPFIDVFMLELKRGYTTSSIIDTIDKGARNKPIYQKWIEKAEDSVKKCGALTWLLIHKRDGRKPMVFYRPAFFRGGVLMAEEKTILVPFQLSKVKTTTVAGMLLEDFLYHFKPEQVLGMRDDRIDNAGQLPKAPPTQAGVGKDNLRPGRQRRREE